MLCSREGGQHVCAAESTTTRIRGSDAVKAALIEATAAMLGEVGPRGISVRDVADRAGVNHGQVHHYFGGKRALLEAAMQYLAREAFDRSRALAGDSPYPPVLAFAEDSDYWRAVCRIVMEGDLDFARAEIEEGISEPRRVLRSLQKEHGGDADDLEFKARFAAMTAQQLGWVAFEDFIMLLADVEPEQREQFRDQVKQFIQTGLGRAFS